MSLYWFFVIENMGIFFTIISVLSAVVALITGLFYSIDRDSKDGRFLKNICVITTTTFFASLLMTIFIPSSKQMMQVYVVDNVLEVVDNDKAKQLPRKVLDVCDKLLNEYLEE